MSRIQELWSLVTSSSLRRQQWLLLCLAFLMLSLATPLPLVRGILYAEEGTTYLRYAREASVSRALLAPHQTYYSLVPNVATLFASRYVPLLFIPVFLAWIALLFHMSLAWLAASVETFETFTQRLLAVLLCLLALGSARELDGTINTQYFLGVAAVLIYLSDPRRKFIARTLLLTAAGLTGVYACMLTPLFMVRAWRKRSIPAVTQAAILTTCSVLQAAVILSQLRFGSRYGTSHVPWARRLAGIVMNSMVLPFTSRLVYTPLANYLATETHHLWLALPLLGAIVFCGLFWLMRNTGGLPHLLLGAGLTVATMSAASIVADPQSGLRSLLGDGDRYYLVANAMTALAILIAAFHLPAHSRQRRYLQVSMCLLLFSGSVDYARYWRSNQFTPAWRSQVEAWKINPGTALYIAPLAWRDHALFYSKTPPRSDLPNYIFDSNLSEQVRAAIPDACFRYHSDQSPPGNCFPR